LSVHRYPVRSMQGESMGAAALELTGVDGDAATNKVLSAKNRSLGPRLLACSAATDAVFGVTVDVGNGPIAVRERGRVEDALAQALGRQVVIAERLQDGDVYESWWPPIPGTTLSDVTVDLPVAMSTKAATFVDLAALHVISTTTPAHLANLSGEGPVDVRRFRPNLVLATAGRHGFSENSWRGRQARVGGAVIEFGSPTPRCVMTTLAQADLGDAPGLLKTVAEHNRTDIDGLRFACAGAYAEVVHPGLVTVGDEATWI
jgi:uncharacterized protein